MRTIKTKVIGAVGLSFKSWSPSRLADYDQCPLYAKLKHLDKMCPACFKGTIKGGYDDTPAICQSCGYEVVKGEALVRGSAVGLALENYVKGVTKKLMPGTYEFNGAPKTAKITHPKVLKIAKDFRLAHAKEKVTAEKLYNFDRNWRPLPPRWSPQVWLIIKMDIFHRVSAKVGKVWDWKTGGVVKPGKPDAGRPYDDEKYVEQLRTYSTGALCAIPELESVSSALCFVDAGPKYDPVIEKKEGCITRADLAKHTQALTRRVLPLFEDRTFSPKANGKCTYCDFQRGRGGPCPY